MNPMEKAKAIADFVDSKRSGESARNQRRERIATAALAGLLADCENHDTDARMALASVMFADALIMELDKNDTFHP